MSTEGEVRVETWEPRILAFVCRWCTYAGADLAGTSRLKYPPQIRIVKLPCSGRIDPLFLLRGFQMGADGVLVSGCHPGDCHYMTGNYYARRRWVLFRELLEFVGFDMRRVHFSWVSAAEGAKFVDVVKKVTDAVREAGPFPGFAPREGATAGAAATSAPAARAAAIEPPLEAIRRDLTEGAIRAVLGYRPGRRPGVMRAAWAEGEAEVESLRFVSEPHPSLVTYLVRRLREDPEGIYGVMAGFADVEAIGVLQAESQIDPARVKVYPVDGAGPPAQAQAPAASRAVPGPDASTDERWDFWTAEFARCMRCNACRQACPLCTCNRCVADKTRPRWIDATPNPAGNWVWNVTRAFHHAGRCADCGGCAAACPAGIPLDAINRHLIQAAEKHFGPRDAGESAHRSPLVAYRLEDEAPFIL